MDTHDVAGTFGIPVSHRFDEGAVFLDALSAHDRRCRRGPFEDIRIGTRNDWSSIATAPLCVAWASLRWNSVDSSRVGASRRLHLFGRIA